MAFDSVEDLAQALACRESDAESVREQAFSALMSVCLGMGGEEGVRKQETRAKHAFQFCSCGCLEGEACKGEGKDSLWTITPVNIDNMFLTCGLGYAPHALQAIEKLCLGPRVCVQSMLHLVELVRANLDLD